MQLVLSQNITLQVGITDASVHYNFRALTWYHNGNKLTADGRITLNSGNTTLTVINSTAADSGVYEARFDGLLIHPYSRICEKAVLDLLRHYPVLKPAVFYVGTTATSAGEQNDRTLGIVQNRASFICSGCFNILVLTGPSDSGIQISFQGNQAVVFFTALQDLSQNIIGKTNHRIDDTVISTWYRNGGSLPLGSRLGPLKRPHLNISQSLVLENSSILDEGTYDALLTIDPRTHFASHLGCHSNYYTFVANTFGATILAQAQLQLKYYGKLLLYHQQHKSIISSLFSCCRTPFIHSTVEWYK